MQPNLTLSLCAQFPRWVIRKQGPENSVELHEARSLGDVFSAGSLRDFPQHFFLEASADGLAPVLQIGPATAGFLNWNQRSLIRVTEANGMHAHADLRQLIGGSERVGLHIIAV